MPYFFMHRLTQYLKRILRIRFASQYALYAPHHNKATQQHTARLLRIPLVRIRCVFLLFAVLGTMQLLSTPFEALATRVWFRLGLFWGVYLLFYLVMMYVLRGFIRYHIAIPLNTLVALLLKTTQTDHADADLPDESVLHKLWNPLYERIQAARHTWQNVISGHQQTAALHQKNAALTTQYINYIQDHLAANRAFAFFGQKIFSHTNQINKELQRMCEKETLSLHAKKNIKKLQKTLPTLVLPQTFLSTANTTTAQQTFSSTPLHRTLPDWTQRTYDNFLALFPKTAVRLNSTFYAKSCWPLYDPDALEAHFCTLLTHILLVAHQTHQATPALSANAFLVHTLDLNTGKTSIRFQTSNLEPLKTVLALTRHKNDPIQPLTAVQKDIAYAGGQLILTPPNKQKEAAFAKQQQWALTLTLPFSSKKKHSLPPAPNTKPNIDKTTVV